MYQAYWGLRESPFRGGTDPRFFHLSLTHEEALARLHFLVDERRRLGLLLGDAGAGKSLVFEVFAQQLRQAGRQVAYLNLVGIGSCELLWQLAGALGLNPPASAALPQVWQMIVDRVVENRFLRVSTVLLLDDADEASREVVAQVARLAQCDLESDATLTVVLAAQAGRLSRLGTRLLELAELRCDLEPWDLGDSIAFVRLALNQCGCATNVFGDEALIRLHALAGGIPRRIKQLADLALLAGAGRELVEIDADTIDSVFQELGVVRTSV